MKMIEQNTLGENNLLKYMNKLHIRVEEKTMVKTVQIVQSYGGEERVEFCTYYMVQWRSGIC